jgi:hypothetical protein
MNFLKQIFCNHDWKEIDKYIKLWIVNYLDEDVRSGNIELYKVLSCKKCGFINTIKTLRETNLGQDRYDYIINLAENNGYNKTEEQYKIQ